jgi:hypothetical protein
MSETGSGGVPDSASQALSRIASCTGSEGTCAPDDAASDPAEAERVLIATLGTDAAPAPGSDRDPPLQDDAEPELRLAQAAQAADLPRNLIGRVEKVAGGATVVRNGAKVELHLGDPVFKGDVVETTSSGALTVKFTDGTVLALSSSAQMSLDEMVYSANSTSNSAFFRMISGVVGLVAGASARGGDFAVETPTAVMGIRGTAVRIEVLPDGGTKFSLIREPNGDIGSILLLDKANPSRVLGSVSDVAAAAIVASIGGAVTRVDKTAAEMQSEGALVRELFQFRPDAPQRRGSLEPDDGLVIPVFDAPAPPRGLDVQTAQVPALLRVAVSSDPAAPPEPISTFVREGSATEDGPAVTLGRLDRDEVRVLAPDILPRGVTFDPVSGRFSLDPSNAIFQHLGVGDTQLVEVEYALAQGNATIPALVSWTVTGRNDAPVARPDVFAGLREKGSTVLAVRTNDTDVDSDPLSIMSVTQPLEGSVSMRGGQLVFSPGRDFEALSAGQTATVTVGYTVADGHGGRSSATARLSVRGEGQFTSPDVSASASGVLSDTGQGVTVTLEAPLRTTTTANEVELAIDFGLVPARTINIVYVLDVSGSTRAPFKGEAVGDLNGDGCANTVLDAEIAGLIDLTDRIRATGFSPADVTVTVIPFNDEADPTSGKHGAPALVFDLGTSGDETIGNALRALDSGGGTDFERALQSTILELAALDPHRSEENFVYFLSDGRSHGHGKIHDELSALRGFGAEIEAVGVGEKAYLHRLDRIDSDGDAGRLVAADGLDASKIGMPRRSGEVTGLELFLNGVAVPGIGPEDLVRDGDDFRLSADAPGFARLVGESNTVQAAITFSTGLVLTTALDVFGALPRSTDFGI